MSSSTDDDCDSMSWDGEQADEYHCSRCNRRFRTEQALSQHIQYSQSHNRCHECDFDGMDPIDLMIHRARSDHGHICDECLLQANVCPEEDCYRRFENNNDLCQHQLVHREADIECVACGDERMFSTYGGMIIHLESGICSNGPTIKELNRLPTLWYGRTTWDIVNYEVLCKPLRWGTYPRYYPIEELPYKCPECDRKFTKMSGLFQHVESPACAITLESQSIEELREHLAKMLGRRQGSESASELSVEEYSDSN